MKENTKGIWTCIKYKNEVVDPTLPDNDPRKERPTIYLWVRDADKKRHRLELKGFKPYFFVSKFVKGDASYIFEKPEIEKYDLVFNDSLYRIFTYIPGYVTKIKRIIQHTFTQAVVKEGDVLFELRYLIDQGLRGSIDWYDISNPVPLLDELHVPLRKIFLDLELWAKKAVQEGKMKSNEYIKCISVFDNYDKVYYTWYCNDLNLDLNSEDKSWKIIWCRTIAEMLRKCFEYIGEKDPDVITGYNIDFDLLNLKQEAERQGLEKEFDYLSALSDKGYAVGKEVTKKHRIRGVDWARKGLLFDGREVIDILDLIRMISRSQLREYSLDFVAKKFLGENLGKYTYKGLPIAPNLTWIWEESPIDVLKYNKRDVELTVKLDEKNDLIDFLDELRKFVGVRLEDAFSNQRMIDTEALRRRKYPLPSKFSPRSDRKEKYPGALVVNPILGLHSWIICLDWKSLYPSIIRTFNIDTDTYVLNPKKLPKTKEIFQFSNLEKTKTWTFVKSPRGLFPQMLDDFTAYRDSFREKYRKEKNAEKKRLWDMKQEVIKVLSNATYGSFGYRSRKHNLEVAEAITSFGQLMIKFAVDIAAELGFEVIYGDTDSIFISSGKNNYGETYNEAIRLQDEIMRRVPQFTSQFQVQEKNLFFITVDKIYDKFLMAVKKRYCGQIIKKDGTKELDVKGLDIKRSDTSYFAANLQQRLIDTLLLGKGKTELVDQIIEELNEIDKLPREEIGVPSAISQNLDSYKKNPIQKKAALNSNKFLGTSFGYGDKPLRVYIKIPPRELVHPRSEGKTEDEQKEMELELKKLNVLAFDKETKFPDWVQINYKKMLRQTVKPKIDKLLETLEIKWEEIEEKLRPELREEKKTKKRKDPLKNTLKLDLFMGGKK